jgi:hypothetical protein
LSQEVVAGERKRCRQCDQDAKGRAPEFHAATLAKNASAREQKPFCGL